MGKPSDTEKKSHFIVKTMTSLKDVKLGDILPTSDFSVLSNNETFIQFEYINEDANDNVIVNPGIHSIVFKNHDLCLIPASFTDDPVYELHCHTQSIKKSVDVFFNKIHIYNKYKIFPKRGILLYGSPGVGKSQAIALTCKEFLKEGKTGIVLWDTSKIAAKDIKDFIKSFEYKNCENFILIAEDIGGIEASSEFGPQTANAALLSLLDNIEQTFKIPTMIIATTNYPENLLPVLTNRPGRFDHVYEISAPTGRQRKELLQFFIDNDETHIDVDVSFIEDKQFDGFAISHIKEILIRSSLYDQQLEQAAKELVVHIKKVKDNFPAKVKSKPGFGSYEED